ncbi:PP2C family protein-serine/threonine phosphatase [Streptomyces sp. UH6]|uniref:PP2C family protein-serine/threonine phosphatase n=1 Tax=Streptomyces sp. UH6 TaxID=2748379 RepID=UPI0015D495A6|nr:GAF domain-containing SpoIIE family protein phosphatase [Streptomyces sp. UH6]NYV77591.1 SpoIIE family protein phosphatase [Streptomyces sp. UH6]
MDQIAQQLRALASTKDRLQGLLDAVLTITAELELREVLRRIVATAMQLCDARYGALGVLDEEGEFLEEFITVGLNEEEYRALAGIEFPHGDGVLGLLIKNPEPLRLEDVSGHPASVGYPPGHPHMRSLLGVAISVRGEIYGDLYLSERHDGRPFDRGDQEVLVALASAAGIAIESARLFEQVRDSAETFQRLLLPTLPDLSPYAAATVYRPAAEPNHLGGDWYDAMRLPDGALGIVIGDVYGHDLPAAAVMSQVRNMLRALFYDRRTPPSDVLRQLDVTVAAGPGSAVTTVLVARVEPREEDWILHWSSAGHFPPLVIMPDGQAEYLLHEPGVPLGVDPELPRPDHRRRLPPRATVVFFTDGVVEHPAHAIDEGMDALLELALTHADLPVEDLVHALADHHPSDGRDDMAILALRLPDET